MFFQTINLLNLDKSSGSEECLPGTLPSGHHDSGSQHLKHPVDAVAICLSPLENDVLLLINEESRKTKQGSSHLSQPKDVSMPTCTNYFDFWHTHRETKHELPAGFLGMPAL